MGRNRRYVYRKDVLLVAFIIKMNIIFRTKGNEKSFNPTYYISLVLAHALSRIRGLEWDFYYYGDMERHSVIRMKVSNK